MRAASVLVVTLFAATVCAPPAWGDEFIPLNPATPAIPPVAPNPVIEIKEKLMVMKLGWASGRIYQNGALLDIGYFGGGAEACFREAPEALESARRFRRERVIGSTLYFVGLATMLTDLVVLTTVVARPGAPPPSVGETLGAAGAAVGGAVVGVVGAVYLGISNSALNQAMNEYNGWLLNRHLPPQNRINLGVFVSQAGGGVNATLRF